jgi:hypothetical protein
MSPCVLALALAAACPVWHREAVGYELSGQSWRQEAIGGPVTLTYSYSNLLEGGLLNASERPLREREILAAVEEAFSVWAAVAPLHFVEVPDQGGNPPVSNYASGQFGTIRLGYLPIDGMGDIKGRAYFPPSSGLAASCRICGDVHFDVQDRWETIGTFELPDLLGATIHEIGHTLGLGHTGIREANMYPVFRRHTGPGSGWLHPDDVAGIQAIYGAGVGSVTPLIHVPEPASWMLLMLGLFVAGIRRRIVVR